MWCFLGLYRDDLRNLIIKRIGNDNLLDKISFISKSEYFTAAVKSPEVTFNLPACTLFFIITSLSIDFIDLHFIDFCRLIHDCLSRQIKVESEKHVLFDHEFTKLLKKLEG